MLLECFHTNGLTLKISDFKFFSLDSEENAYDRVLGLELAYDRHCVTMDEKLYDEYLSKFNVTLPNTPSYLAMSFFKTKQFAAIRFHVAANFVAGTASPILLQMFRNVIYHCCRQSTMMVAIPLEFFVLIGVDILNI